MYRYYRVFISWMLFSLLLGPSLAFCAVIINGTITNTQGTPLSGVIVTTGNSSTTTTQDGEYGFYLHQTGTFDVTASKAGYATQTQSVTVSDGETVELNFTLALSPLTIENVTPNWEETGKNFDIDIYGEGFSTQSRVSLSLDSGNKEQLLGSIYVESEEALDVEVVGNYAYVLHCRTSDMTGVEDCYFDVIDIRNPEIPQRIGRKLLLDESSPGGKIIAGTRGYIYYVRKTGSLQVFDITEPSVPDIVAYIPQITALDVIGDIAYLIGTDGFQAMDMKDPSNPAAIGDSLAIPGFVNRVTVAGGYAYLAGDEGGQGHLYIVNIVDPENLYLVGSINLSTGPPHSLAVEGTLACVTENNSGLYVVDVSVPSSPSVISDLPTPKAEEIVISDSIAYIADSMIGLLIVDLSDSTNPDVIGGVDTTGKAHDVAVAGTVAYLAFGDGGFYSIDASEPEATAAIGIVDTPGDALGVFTVNDVTYIADGSSLQLVDISDFNNPKLGSSIDMVGARDVTVKGGYAYVASGESSLHIANISNPESPTLLTTIDVGHANAVSLENNLLYVGGESLSIVDIAVPTSPQVFNPIEFQAPIDELVVSNNMVYAVSGNRLFMIDVSNPHNPVTEQYYPGVNYQFLGIELEGNIVYLRTYYEEEDTGCNNGCHFLYMLDVNNPTAPDVMRIEKFNLPIEVLSVANGIVYLVQDKEIEAWDFTDLSVPLKLGAVNTFHTSFSDLTVSDNIAHAALGFFGLACAPVPMELNRPNPLQDSATQLKATIPPLHFEGDYSIQLIDGTSSQELRGAITLSNRVANAKAIIVAGYGPGPTHRENWLWDETVLNANYAYKTLLYQGYRPENIRYLSEQEEYIYVDGTLQQVVWGEANLANLEASIINWAYDADDVVIYLVDHGGPETFKIKENDSVTEILSASELADWLNLLQDVMPGRLLLVYEACKSGSFLHPLRIPEGKNYNRILLTSSASDKDSYFDEDGRLSFAYQFWATINENAQIDTAFNHGFSMMQHVQEAWMDTNGNGVPNEITIDKIEAEDRIIGRGWQKASDNPVLQAIANDQTLTGTNSAILWAENPEHDHLLQISKVWVVLVPPNYNPSIQDIAEEQLISLDLPWNGNENRYQLSYDEFVLNGEYKALYYAMDDEESISLPKSSRVTQTGGVLQCDINRDGVVDLADEILVLQVLSNINPGDFVNAAYDANLNGQLDLADAVYILNKIGK